MKHYINLIAIALVSLSALFLFALHLPALGYSTLIAALGFSFFMNRQLFEGLLLVAIGIITVSFVPINADVSTGHVVAMGPALVIAIAVPFLLSKYVLKRNRIEFPFHFKERWSRNKWLYMTFVLVGSFIILPWYLISTEVYMNWPAASDADSIIRLFIGTNVVGIWDELFFICIVLSVFRRYVSFWQANFLQAIIFSSFLYELGFQSIGPLLTFPFALAQGYVFKRSGNLFYVIVVHLVLDFILFLTLIHAHNRDFLPIFIY